MKVGDPRCCRGVCGLGDGPKIIPRQDWPKDGVDLSDEVTEILDQDGLSSAIALRAPRPTRSPIACKDTRAYRCRPATWPGK